MAVTFLALSIAQTAAAADVTYSAASKVTINGMIFTINSGSTASSVVVGAGEITITTGVGDQLTFVSPNKFELATNSATIKKTCSATETQVIVPASTTITITPSAIAPNCSTDTGGGGGGGGSSAPAAPSTPAAPTTTPPVTVTPEKAKETPKVEEKAPAKTKEVTKELTKKLTLMDSKSKASLVLQKGTQLTSGDAPYAGSVSSPGQLNPSKAIVDFGSPSATGTVVQAVQSKTTGDVLVWLSKPATLTFKMTPAQKGTKYKGKDRYGLEAYYYNPMTKSFTKLTGKKTGANFAVSDVTYISGPFFLVQTDMKPAPKAKKSKK